MVQHPSTKISISKKKNQFHKTFIYIRIIKYCAYFNKSHLNARLTSLVMAY